MCIGTWKQYSNGNHQILKAEPFEIKTLQLLVYLCCFQGLPCHLYFDLEFNKKVNPQKRGDEMVDLLILVTQEVLFDKYSIECNEDWIVELDSSTEGTCSSWFIVFSLSLFFF